MAEMVMASSLMAARTRLGRSREALAYHSGVSASAIVHRASGRRKDVRLSSLSLLADATIDLARGAAAASPAACPPSSAALRIGRGAAP